jgi:hypothetical protein
MQAVRELRKFGMLVVDQDILFHSRDYARYEEQQ